ESAARMTYVANHPWLWRLGWFPWQLAALSVLLIALALLSTRGVPRLPAILTFLVTIGAIIPDQAGQLLWMTHGVSLAHIGDVAQSVRCESSAFTFTAAWGGTLYTLAAIGWTWCFIALGAWKRWLVVSSVLLWSLFAFVSLSLFLPPDLRPYGILIAGGNA